MTTDTDPFNVASLAQWGQGQSWRLELAQDRPEHFLLWITRGQGRILFDGMRRGVGTHNAVFIPAGTLFALDLGRQAIGQIVTLPAASALTLPEIPRHLRIMDVQIQSELTGLIEAAQRERLAQRPLCQEALEGHAMLVSVWLRRQILNDDHVLPPRNAAQRLSQRFCKLVSLQYRSGQPMAAFAEMLDVTPTHLTRAVKSATGKTAADLLTERILYEARCLLTETREPAQNIANYLGFGSAAYFTRFIQHHTGKTPSKLRSLPSASATAATAAGRRVANS